MTRYFSSLKSRNYYYKEVFAFLCLLFAAYFFRQEQSELRHAGELLGQSRSIYVFAGVLLSMLYICLHGWMYQSSFKVIHERVTFSSVAVMFLRRNLISVFLPGGGVTSLAFFTKELEKQGLSKTKINFASYIYGVTGIVSLIMVAIPVLFYLVLKHTASTDAVLALLSLTGIVVLLLLATWSFFAGGWVFSKIASRSPQAEVIRTELRNGNFSKIQLMAALGFSMLIELAGIVHLYIAAAALGIDAGPELCIVGYTIATLFLAMSPFLRGLGAVEVSLTYVLTTFGMSSVQAISVTVLYRLFEFWAPLLAGACSFIFNKRNLFLRFFPALLTFSLGMVNIVSVMTPPLASRMRLLHDFVPVAAIHASNQLVLLMGIVLLICAAFLLKGLRNAWWFALVLSFFSLIGHLTKAIDYEEAIAALFTLVTLLVTGKRYQLKADRNIQHFGLRTSLAVLAAVLVFGVTGFYFLDKRHFDTDFSLSAAVIATLENFVLIGSDLEPKTHFAVAFLYLINLLGVGSIGLLVWTAVRPYTLTSASDGENRQRASDLTGRLGRSAMDYFKVYPDKHWFFSERHEGFIAYRFSGGYAVVLEQPVCMDDSAVIADVVKEFEVFCKANGLRPMYYRVDEHSLNLFSDMGKKALIIGQEAIVDLGSFTLEGKERKSMRNALNSLEKKGFHTKIYPAPQKEGFLQKLQLVSDQWLSALGRSEMVFSQGMFDLEELKGQTIITLENAEEKVVAFLNIIPDYQKGETTYDLIRKTKDAPAGNMDALIIELIHYARERGFNTLNMGLAPMSGAEQERDFPHRTMKFAYEKLQQFRHYHGLRDFKDKFGPEWENKYLIYEDYYDLLQAPVVLPKIMKP